MSWFDFVPESDSQDTNDNNAVNAPNCTVLIKSVRSKKKVHTQIIIHDYNIKKRKDYNMKKKKNNKGTFRTNP